MADSIPCSFKPGIHSHNTARVSAAPNIGRTPNRPSTVKEQLLSLRTLLLVIGLACLGYFAYTYANQSIYQSYQNWVLDKEITQQQPSHASAAMPIPVNGSVIGRVNISRLNFSAVVLQGVGEDTLKEAVGHVPSTAFAGQTGNFAIAAHRDTLFRGLKDIKIGDFITFESRQAQFHYQVAATKIVKPSDVSVLRPDGGGLISLQKGGPAPKLLTMITCYPFYYVGSAPYRFIVQAKLVENAK